MDNFDSVAVAETFVGKKLGQLISKEVKKNKTVWVYEGSVIRSELNKAGKIKNVAWTVDEGQEMFFVKNKMELAATYVETARMKLAKEYKVEIAKVYADGFKSNLYDTENGIVRDFSRVNAILAELGSKFRF